MLTISVPAGPLAVWREAAQDLADSLEKEAQQQAWLAETHDHRTATLAFVRKGQPAYLGR